MYAQVTNLSVPIGQVDTLRELVANEYLKGVQERDGFVMAHMLEAIDDPEKVQLITYWDNHQAIENARKTGGLKETVQVLAAHMPGVKILRQGYLVTVNTAEQHVSVS